MGINLHQFFYMLHLAIIISSPLSSLLSKRLYTYNVMLKFFPIAHTCVAKHYTCTCTHVICTPL